MTRVQAQMDITSRPSRGDTCRAYALTAVLGGALTWRPTQRSLTPLREVEPGLLPVMLARRLVVGQRRILLVHKAPQLPRLALALASIGVLEACHLLLRLFQQTPATQAPPCRSA
jgi:hypothetical protein